MTQRAHSFAPIVARGARVLVLGSLPGATSLRARQYYAHPRNAFWPIMASLLGFDAAASYRERVRQLRAAGVALWDVCHSARRAGSLDAAIERDDLIANDIGALLGRHSSIRAVFFNGSTAASLYRQKVMLELPAPLQQLAVFRLPSTSPAHAAMSAAQKARSWSRIARYLDRAESA